MRGGGGLIALGETEQDEVRQQPQRPARPVRHPGRQLHRAGLRAPPVGSLLGARRAPNGSAASRHGRPPRPGPRGLLLPRGHARALQRRPRDRAQLAHAPRPTGAPRRRSPSTAPAASSCSPTPTCSATTASASSTTQTLWLNLVYWAAQPAFAGGRPRRLARPRRPRLGELKERGRGAAPPPGARRLGRPRPRTTPVASRARRDDLERRPSAPRTSPTRRSTSTPSAPTCAPGSTPASPSPTSSARWSRSGPSGTAATASSTSSCSRCTSRTPRATRASRR